MRAWTTRLTGVSAVLLVALTWFGGNPSAQSSRAIELSLAHFEANRGIYGLSNPGAELRVRRSRSDLSGVTHVRFDQVYRGRPVFEGEAITHVDAAGEVTVTNALRGIINLDTNARVGRNAAVQTAIRDIGPLGSYELRDASLWVLPLSERSVVDRLVWQVAVLVENDFEDPAEWRYFVDAHNGSVVWAFDALETGAATGLGKTMYTGDKAVNTDFAAGTFYLRDPTRGGGNYTCDKNGKTNAPQCSTFSRSNNIFGNNQKNSSDRATAGADAHFGLQATWDYYSSMFGRNGINGSGRKTYSRVHYGTNYQNAFWSNSCFCMTYGDGGSTFYPLVSVDIAGHEMSHGVMSTEANLTYSGESGGLNESNSDIFGTMVEYAVNNPTVTLDAPDYWIGERIYRSNYSTGTYQQTKALRYMDDPFRDGRSPACWSSGLGSLDVHYSSGPNNHMYYLLAQGGTSKCNGNVVGGIGQDKAARIWYKAISEYMTSSTNYHGARTACLQAATSLYPSDPAPYNAVNAAFAAINVTGL